MLTNTPDTREGLPPHLFARGERQVAILDHVLDLAFHGHREQHQPVQQEYRPEDGHVEDREQRHRQPHTQGLE